MSKLILLDKIKNPDIPGLEDVLYTPSLPPKITFNCSKSVQNYSNNIHYSNLLSGSYYMSPLTNFQSSTHHQWWIPNSVNTSDVYVQWYESAHKKVLHSTQKRNTTKKTKLKYFKRKLEVIDTKIDAEKFINAQNKLSTLMKSLKCDLCNAVMNSSLQAKLHYQGKPHQKKVCMFLNQSTKILKHEDDQILSTIDNDSDVYCDICKTWFTSQTDASQHYAGKKHLKASVGLSKKKASKKVFFQNNIPRDLTSQLSIGMTFESEVQIPSQNSSLINSTVSQDLQSYQTSLQCELCGISVNRQDQLDIHKQGTKHLKMLNFHRIPQINKESVPIISASIDYSIYRTPSGQYYCAPCNLSLNSEVTFGRHMESKKHKNQTIPKQKSSSYSLI